MPPYQYQPQFLSQLLMSEVQVTKFLLKIWETPIPLLILIPHSRNLQFGCRMSAISGGDIKFPRTSYSTTSFSEAFTSAVQLYTCFNGNNFCRNVFDGKKRCVFSHVLRPFAILCAIKKLRSKKAKFFTTSECSAKKPLALSIKTGFWPKC